MLGRELVISRVAVYATPSWRLLADHWDNDLLLAEKSSGSTVGFTNVTTLPPPREVSLFPEVYLYSFSCGVDVWTRGKLKRRADTLSNEYNNGNNYGVFIVRHARWVVRERSLASTNTPREVRAITFHLFFSSTSATDVQLLRPRIRIYSILLSLDTWTRPYKDQQPSTQEISSNIERDNLYDSNL